MAVAGHSARVSEGGAAAGSPAHYRQQVQRAGGLFPVRSGRALEIVGAVGLGSRV